MRLYLPHHEGDVLAAATMLIVGDHVWYSYSASTGREREVQHNNAMQWRMMPVPTCWACWRLKASTGG